MSRRMVVLVVILGLAVLAIACESDGPSRPTGEFPYLIAHIDRGCVPGTEAATPSLAGAYLTAFSVDGDTLSLDVHFQANCCPGFVEDVAFEPSLISIDVGDTLYGCRCICDYDNTFRLRWPDPGPVGIHFASRRYGSPSAICSFDTLIVLPGGEPEL